MYILVIRQLAVMLLIAAAGFGVSKAFRFGGAEQQFASKILLYFINPCLIISQFNIAFDPVKLKNLGIIIALSAAAHLAMTAVALLFIRGKTEWERSLDSIDRTAVVFTNCAFIGIPLIEGVLGGSGVFYLLGYIVFFNLYLWTFGYWLLGGRIKIARVITNPNIIAVLGGIALFCIPRPLPELAARPISYIGAMNVGMSMLLLGMLFAGFRQTPAESNAGRTDEGREGSPSAQPAAAKFRLKDHPYVGRIARLCILRCVVCSAVMLLITLGAFRLIAGLGGISGTPAEAELRTLCYVVLISTLCPAGMSVSSFAVIFHKNQSYSGLLIVAPSLASILTLPATIAIAEQFF
ncbi:MAG: AEC family transporter [Treponemataceae bacterium]|nr:AEC family transporter [Treponemataceae bacterium]